MVWPSNFAPLLDEEETLDFASMPAGVFKTDSTLARRLEALDHLYVSHDGGIDADGLIGDERRCLFVKVLDSGDGERAVIPCGRWICRYCRERKAETESRRFAAAFAVDGRTVYWEGFDTRAKATNAVRYATNLGHAALVIPLMAGGAIVVTTHHRKGAAEPDELLPFLEMVLACTPAHTKDAGENRVVNPNRVLRDSLLGREEFRQQEIHDRRAESMDDGALAALESRDDDKVWYWPTKSFDQTLERLGLVESYSPWGHVWRYRVPDQETEPWAWFLFTEQRSQLKRSRFV